MDAVTCYSSYRSSKVDLTMLSVSSSKRRPRVKEMSSIVSSKQDTASCDLAHSGGSSNLDANLNTACIDLKRGFQHVYRSSGKSSAVTQMAHKLTLEGGKNTSFVARKREYSKNKKLQSLLQVQASSVHCVGKDLLGKGSKPIFYSGTNDDFSSPLPPCARPGILLSAIDHLKVVDTVSGARLMLPNEDVVFTLIPREYAIRRLPKVLHTVKALYALEDAVPKSETRGKTRIAISESDGRYTTVGLKPCRYSPGIVESWPKALGEWPKKQIRRLMNVCHEVASGFILGNHLRGIACAHRFTKWPVMKGLHEQSIWEVLPVVKTTT